MIPYGPWETRGVAVSVILLMTFINYLGVRTGGRTQNVFTMLKLTIVVGVVGVCIVLGTGDLGRVGPMLPSGVAGTELFGSFAAAMVLTLFTYSGWHFSTHVAGEIRNPERNVPFSIIVGMAVVVCVYLLVNLAFVYVLPFDDLRGSSFVGADAVRSVVGPMGGALVSLAIVVSTMGSLNAQLLNYPRIVFSLARDGMFFRKVSQVHATRGTPAVAILIQGLWASGFALSGTYQDILTYVAFVNHSFLTLAVAAVIVLRIKEPNLPRPYRVWGYPVTPLIFLAISGWFLIGVLMDRFWQSMVGVGLMLAGLPFYFYWRKQLIQADAAGEPAPHTRGDS